jgi:CHASE2 domain-containing sensor protein
VQPSRGRGRGRLLLLTGIALLTTFLLHVVTVRWLPQAHNLELLVYDWHIKSMPALKPDPRLVLIGMDDGSLQHLNCTSYPLPRHRNSFDLGPLHAPIGEGSEILIRYIGPKGSFPYVPYSEVYDGSWRARRGAKFFQDKIVLVGRISYIEDRQNTPQNDMQGVEILMNATQTLLQHNWIRHLNELNNFLAELALCLLLALAIYYPIRVENAPR